MPRIKARVLASLLLLSAAAGCQPRTSAEVEVNRSGWFHTVWADAPQYWLVDESGRWTRLIIIATNAETSAERLRTLDRKLVTVTGFPDGTDRSALRVTSITPVEAAKP